jgi:hypothetical protein
MSHHQEGYRRSPAGRSGAGMIRRLVLAGLTIFPLTAAGQETSPLISTMNGELKQACRTAANVEACELLVEALRAYFGPTYEFGERLAIGASKALGLKPARTSCEECVDALAISEAYITGEGNPSLLSSTLHSACDRKFRVIPSEAAQCKAELDRYVLEVIEFVVTDFPPLVVCRTEPRAYCPTPP